ncbi:ABC transporter ATP-binding protein [Caldicellulosiruptoraceae bacterium PP1]
MENAVNKTRQEEVKNKEILLKVENLRREFGSGSNKVIAVKDVNFEVRRGEIISLLGESGSGKTTVARMILRLLEPTSGRILYKGEDISKFKNRKKALNYWKHVQAVFQDPFSSFNIFYSVHRVLNNTYRLMDKEVGKEEREKEIRNALETVGLNPNELLNKKIFELSGGQRQRIMIARIILLKPDILIADEPTSMIDASSRVSILNYLMSLRTSYNMTIIFITHDIGLAYYTSDRLLVMNKGEIVEQGTADEVVENPKHEYTKKLLSDVPVIMRKWDL